MSRDEPTASSRHQTLPRRTPDVRDGNECGPPTDTATVPQASERGEYATFGCGTTVAGVADSSLEAANLTRHLVSEHRGLGVTDAGSSMRASRRSGEANFVHLPRFSLTLRILEAYKIVHRLWCGWRRLPVDDDARMVPRRGSRVKSSAELRFGRWRAPRLLTTHVSSPPLRAIRHGKHSRHRRIGQR